MNPNQGSGLATAEWVKKFWIFYMAKSHGIVNRSDYLGEIRSTDFHIGIALTNLVITFVVSNRSFH